MKVVVVGGGIAGLAAARKLEALIPDVNIELLERSKLGGRFSHDFTTGSASRVGPTAFLRGRNAAWGYAKNSGSRMSSSGVVPRTHVASCVAAESSIRYRRV